MSFSALISDALGVLGSLTRPIRVLPTLFGQQTMANSEPVVIASDQTPIPITGTISASNAAVGVIGAAPPASASFDGLNVGGALRGLTGSNPSGSVFTAQVDVAAVNGTTADSNSGVKSAGTLRVVIATDQPQLTNLIGNISASDETSAIYSGTTALTPKFAVITASSSGATTLVAAVTSKKIRVTNVVLLANAAVNVKFQSHVTPTDKTGLLYLAANGGFAPGYDPTGHFETIAGEALDINLSGAIAVGGWLKYIEV